jgi:hypothetical protein
MRPMQPHNPPSTSDDAAGKVHARGIGTHPSGRGPYIIGAAFLLVAGLMLLAGDPPLPKPPSVFVDPEDFSDLPMRSAPQHPATILRGGYEMACNECHGLFFSPAETSPWLTQHQHIELDHGLNDRCFNCHDRFNRDMLILPGNVLIPFDESPRLCASCHGPTYRDWELGIHGRTFGSWDTTSGKQRHLACTQCHDPHAPAFGPMTLLPGPNTLRMRTPEKTAYDDEHKDDKHIPSGKRNPLKHWMKNRADQHEAAAAPPDHMEDHR